MAALLLTNGAFPSAFFTRHGAYLAPCSPGGPTVPEHITVVMQAKCGDRSEWTGPSQCLLDQRQLVQGPLTVWEVTNSHYYEKKVPLPTAPVAQHSITVDENDDQISCHTGPPWLRWSGPCLPHPLLSACTKHSSSLGRDSYLFCFTATKIHQPLVMCK